MQQEGIKAKTEGSGGGIGRAALLGLCAGMLLGGIFLVVQGLRSRILPANCSELSELECSFLRETAVEVGRVQTVAGAALVALAAAVVVLLRSRSSQSPGR
ncbi:MAG TPA: hypothetical protein VLQ93_15650 [Myxococcaceae bacterium]|nr:hypothetical protein [Myxococcaceae bacterium]